MPRLIAIFAALLLAATVSAQHASTLSTFHSPVSLEQAEFGPDGSLRSIRILNSSGQTVTAVQFGCFVVHVDSRVTTVVGKDNPIRTGMQAGDELAFGRQTIAADTDDALQLYYFIARVTFEDGTSWKAPLEALRHQIYRKNDRKTRPLTPA